MAGTDQIVQTRLATSPVPDIYRLASVRVVTSCDGQYIGIGFDTDNHAQTHRFRLTVRDALQLAELIRSHSLTSSGMSNAEVSSSSPVAA